MSGVTWLLGTAAAGLALGDTLAFAAYHVWRRTHRPPATDHGDRGR